MPIGSDNIYTLPVVLVNDAAAGIEPTAIRFDSIYNDIASALNGLLTDLNRTRDLSVKDGSNLVLRALVRVNVKMADAGGSAIPTIAWAYNVMGVTAEFANYDRTENTTPGVGSYGLNVALETLTPDLDLDRVYVMSSISNLFGEGFSQGDSITDANKLLLVQNTRPAGMSKDSGVVRAVFYFWYMNDATGAPVPDETNEKYIQNDIFIFELKEGLGEAGSNPG